MEYGVGRLAGTDSPYVKFRGRFLRRILGLIALAVLGGSLQAAELNWQQRNGHRHAPLIVAPSGKTGFTEIAAPGITFTNRLSDERSLTNQIFLNGSGVAAGDVDGDGLCDLYFCGLDSPNALYRNLGQWRFEDTTTYAGVACSEQASTGAAFADVDGDGDLDLLVNGVFRGTRLFLNDGRGRFRETTVESGLRGTSGSVSMALADIDGDGLLDLYVVNYRNDTMRDMPEIHQRRRHQWRLPPSDGEWPGGDSARSGGPVHLRSSRRRPGKAKPTCCSATRQGRFAA